MTNRERFLAYLSAYESKSIELVASMFANDITLRDWKISVSGKDAAVFETRSNFSAARTIAIQTLRIFESERSVAGELKIIVNGTEELHVVDVLEFDHQGRIRAIRAFIGRGDA